jgi:hypothetical protein
MRKTQPIALAAALLLGVGFGSVAVAHAAGPTNQSTGAPVTSPSYSTNTKGQTYGSNEYAPTVAAAPDLIEAIGTKGQAGYVRNEDLNPPLPSSPAEALKQQAADAAAPPKVIPLYDVNGNVIGEFQFGANTINSEPLPSGVLPQSITKSAK